MQKETGEIREYEKVPAQERNDEWSEPFKLGDEVVVLGVRMRIVKIKKQRKEIHLAHYTTRR